VAGTMCPWDLAVRSARAMRSFRATASQPGAELIPALGEGPARPGWPAGAAAWGQVVRRARVESWAEAARAAGRRVQPE